MSVREGFRSHSDGLFYNPLVSFYRHDELFCRAGLYRVVTGMGEWGFSHFNAVVDDFGNLVKVSQ